MIYRRFGKTDLSLSVLSFGCMRSMHSWQDLPETQIPAQAQSSLEALTARALDSGINHIETAAGYGSSERQLGLVLPKFTRSSFILQSKVAPREDPQEFLHKVEQSMARLKVRRLDLLALHGINDHRALWYSCRKNGCLAAARRLQDRGLIGHIGFSGHGPSDVIMQALEHEEDGGFDYCNMHWYYILDVNRQALACAASRDIGVLIISPTDKGGHLHTPSDELTKLCAPLSPMLFNDIYCLNNQGVGTITIGASAPEQFDEHLKALAYLSQAGTATIAAIDERLRQAMARRTGNARPDAEWHELPSWEYTPGNINLRMILWLSNLYRGWDMHSYSRARYSMLDAGSSWVPGNKASRVDELDFSSLETGGSSLQPLEIQHLARQAHELLGP